MITLLILTIAVFSIAEGFARLNDNTLFRKTKDGDGFIDARDGYVAVAFIICVIFQSVAKMIIDAF